MHTASDVYGGMRLPRFGWPLPKIYQGFAHIVQPLNYLLTGEGAKRKSEHVALSEDALKTFKVRKWVCMTAPVLAFADYTKPFLLETDVFKDGLGAVLSQKQAER